MKWCVTATVIPCGAESRKIAKARKRKKKRFADSGRFYGYGESKESRVLVLIRTSKTSMNVQFLYLLDELTRLDEERKEPRSDAERRWETAKRGYILPRKEDSQ